MDFKIHLTASKARASLWRCGANGLIMVLAAIGMIVSTQAQADFKLCNDTASRVGVAVGYRDAEGEPASEGWWTIASQTCEVLLRGAPPSRIIYIRAVDYDQGGGWSGSTKLCTQNSSFAIRGIRDCRQHGYQSEGFMEVDTGGSKQWTIRLTSSDKQGDSAQ